MFLDNRMITGIKAIMVSTIAINAVSKEVLKNRKEITKATVANAIATP